MNEAQRRTFGLGTVVVAAFSAFAQSAGCTESFECGTEAGSVVGRLAYAIDHSQTDADLKAVDTREDLMVAVGAGGVVITGDPGYGEWEPRDSGVDVDLAGVATGDGSLVVAVGAGGTVIRSENAGATWTSVDAGLTQDLRSVAAVGDAGFVAIADGMGAYSEDGGVTWVEATGLEGRAWRDVAAVGGDTVIAVGDAGAFARSDDAGMGWSSSTVADFEHLDLVGVAFRSSAEGRVATNSGRILTTEDLGESWDTDGIVPEAARAVAVVSTETWVAADSSAVFYRHHTDPTYVEKVLNTDATRFEDVRVTRYGDAILVGNNGVVLRALLDYDVDPRRCY